MLHKEEHQGSAGHTRDGGRRHVDEEDATCDVAKAAAPSGGADRLQTRLSPPSPFLSPRPSFNNLDNVHLPSGDRTHAETTTTATTATATAAATATATGADAEIVPLRISREGAEPLLVRQQVSALALAAASVGGGDPVLVSQETTVTTTTSTAVHRGHQDGARSCSPGHTEDVSTPRSGSSGRTFHMFASPTDHWRGPGAARDASLGQGVVDEGARAAVAATEQDHEAAVFMDASLSFADSACVQEADQADNSAAGPNDDDDGDNMRAPHAQDGASSGNAQTTSGTQDRETQAALPAPSRRRPRGKFHSMKEHFLRTMQTHNREMCQ